ncbi:MAG TPA: DUF4337 family protein [Candidatus Elarobacter sp.]
MHEHQVHAAEGPRWVPVAAATLAVLAALTGYLSNLRSTAALIAKNDSIVATTHASDTYAEYQASRLKFYVAQSTLDGGVGSGGNPERLRSNVKREAAKGPPLLDKAHAYEHDAASDDVRSEHLLAQHETFEIATTLFEVAIVLISITALVGSRLLVIVSGAAASLGLAIALYGLLR